MTFNVTKAVASIMNISSPFWFPLEHAESMKLPVSLQFFI
jgi:hypothetical protein